VKSSGTYWECEGVSIRREQRNELTMLDFNDVHTYTSHSLYQRECTTAPHSGSDST
jgi:hypothetical protein